MITITYLNAHDFLLKTQDFLEENEAANNLLLGICFQLKRFSSRVKTGPYFILVTTDNDLPLLAGVMTPARKLIIYGKNEGNGAVESLARRLLADKTVPPGVLGPASIAGAFAETWTSMTGMKHNPGLHQRIYELRQVIPPPPVPGWLRAATVSEVDLVTRWALAFQIEAMSPGDPAQTRETIERRIDRQEVYLWEDGQPVSLACRARPISHGISVNFVYTPPEFRRRGYATAAVAALSQLLLNLGWKFCTLFTDLTNPTSNHIYQLIGYIPVCDFDEYIFDAAAI